MIILRVPPFPLTAIFDVPSDEMFYNVYIQDSIGDLLVDDTFESDANSQITIQLPEDAYLYDETYLVSIYIDDDGANGDKVVEDRLEIVRPYTTITGDTASELAQNQSYEELARLIIDSITGGFYYKKTVVETVGLGADYIPVWYKPHKILTVVENNIIVFDHITHNPGLEGATFHITEDKTAITRHVENDYNRRQAAALAFPAGVSDTLDIYGRASTMFPKDYDYIFYLETGYQVVPADIKRATDLLIEDIKCGKIDYYKRYVKSYSTDQFKLDYDPKMMNGTGNLIVDKILAKYNPAIYKIGVL